MAHEFLTLTRRALARGIAGGAALSALPLTAFAQETPVIEDFAIGAEDAKVTISEYASFTCPHCAAFHAEIFPLLKADYIDTGKVRFEYREVYFDRYGLWAAMMARCGGPMRYFGITDILFDTQREWAGSDDQAQVVANIKKIGVTAGMDAATIDACLMDDAMAKALVAHYQENATADGLEGTPSFKINGTMYSNMSYAELKAILDAELAK
jgi:protein-disulfide isomerase